MRIERAPKFKSSRKRSNACASGIAFPRRAKSKFERLLRTLSLFSGGGGLDLGFAAAGFQICVATDIDPFSCKTLEINSNRRPFFKHACAIQRDIKEVSASDLLTASKAKLNKIDAMIGGPPCQSFSVFGRRKGLGDPRGNLVWEYIRIIREVQPVVFVFENVAGLKSIHNGDLFKNILSAFSIDGKYEVASHDYQMADFGIPQFRDRVFFIGTRNGKRVPLMLPTHGRNNLFASTPYRTVAEALRFLPEPGIDSILPNHTGRKHSQRIIERYRALSYGERDPKTRINKLHPERPSFTIIVGSDNGGGKGHVHPFTPREVTPRESARMQTFPDWWEFYGTGRHVIRQVGNAVPPLFAALLAEHIKAHVFGEKRKRTYEELIDILGLDYMRGR